MEPIHKLYSQHECCLQWEFVSTKLEEIGKTWSHQLHCHVVGTLLLPIAIDLCETFSLLFPIFLHIAYLAIDLMQKEGHIGLIHNKRKWTFCWLYLYSYFLFSNDVLSYMNTMILSLLDLPKKIVPKEPAPIFFIIEYFSPIISFYLNIIIIEPIFINNILFYL